MNTRTSLAALFTLLTTTACGTVDFSVAEDAGVDADPTTDVKPPKPDADPPKPDTGKTDTGKPGHDAGFDVDPPKPDSGQPGDAGVDSGMDASKPTPDTGVPTPDSGEKKDAGEDTGSKEDAHTGSDAGHPEDSGHVEDSGSTPDAACVPTSCAGGIPVGVCGGVPKEFPACSGTDSVCLAGTCVECVPSTIEVPNTQCATYTSDTNPNVGGGYFADIQTCDATGHWTIPQNCGAATPGTFVCSGATGSASCGGTCQPGTNQCAAETQIGTATQCPQGKVCQCANVGDGYVGVSNCDNTGTWGYAYDCIKGNCGVGAQCEIVNGQPVVAGSGLACSQTN